jgi:DNA-binding transcriptional LysR family regulator
MTAFETGRAYYERCTRLLADLEETEQAVSDMHAIPRGELRVNPRGPTRRQDTKTRVLAIWQAVTLSDEADEGCNATELRQP